MIHVFHENRLLADDSHEISYLMFFRKLGKIKKVSSAAVLIGVLRIKMGQWKTVPPKNKSQYLYILILISAKHMAKTYHGLSLSQEA